MSSGQLIFAYLFFLLAALAVLILYSEFRSRRFRPSRNPDRIFRCEKCGVLYTDDHDAARSRCPQCGANNQAIVF